ncbi:ankyrin repeat domain-containing protein [Stenotrophomonas maltophilia]|uniref:ankyrin repeat domain-containing protein n=1 Tax=Stenotrophomonas maltophilia TaxID=40324 RepID=UPI001FA77E27|nr:ankyrin repeat domain-containing protein [Stenotrophomonas maltophilia]
MSAAQQECCRPLSRNPRVFSMSAVNHTSVQSLKLFTKRNDMFKKYDTLQTRRFLVGIANIQPEVVENALSLGAEPTPLFRRTLAVWTAQLRVPADEVQPHGDCELLDKEAGMLIDTLPLHDMAAVKWLGRAGSVPIASADGNSVRMGSQEFTNATISSIFNMFASIVANNPDDFTDAQNDMLSQAREIIHICLDYKCNLAGTDERGMSILHWCSALYDDKELIERLVEFGENPSLKDNEGFTPQQVAAFYGHVDAFAGFGCTPEPQNDIPPAVEPTPTDRSENDWSQLEPCNAVQYASFKPHSRFKQFFNILLGRTSPLDHEN